MASSTIQHPRFRLEFRVLSDGLDTAKAQALTQTGLHAHRSQFPSFPNLPPELRLKIWEYFLAPRIIGIVCHKTETETGLDSDDEPEPWESYSEYFGCPLPFRNTPILLLVNRETRALALKYYEPSFSWQEPLTLLHDTARTTRRSPHSAWFDYARDTLYLRGELEPCDSYGFNAPMAYFLSRRETERVRKLALSFSALGYGESGPQHIFGALFHVVDRFPGIEGRRVWVGVAPRDELTHVLMGGLEPLVPVDGEVREGVNILQKIWDDWYRGGYFTAPVRFELVRKLDLPERVAEGGEGGEVPQLAAKLGEVEL
ncbi:uncharacterized protein F4822DRAFT_241679 [Hypoxylon trugodes]|uniref:uncharacterized protein n=1 Tax=Hypoxylon trugodes TaxID=326681 RepID=UPI002192AA5D|nr:uncharacterized protein F4822DRAFT_241679 [Hypoxylon trugodes]KAI1388305.1 hypothetical protein F4822DRAFT_241679 [Hypoxylon trugodes]